MNYNQEFTLKNIEYFCEIDQVLKIEEWKNVPYYEGHYMVSDLGRIKSLKCHRGKGEIILSQREGVRGYMYVGLFINNSSKTIKTHQLVAMAFFGHVPCGFKWVINHKNFIKIDNRKVNLEVTTARDNSNKKHLKHSSIYTGVYWNSKNKKWRSKITFNGKVINLGSFDCEKEASEYYENALISIKNKTKIIIKKPAKTSKYKGVHFDSKKQKYIAKININKKTLHLGAFIKEINAHQAYQKALNNLPKDYFFFFCGA